jgi:hypothetical protein
VCIFHSSKLLEILHPTKDGLWLWFPEARSRRAGFILDLSGTTLIRTADEESLVAGDKEVDFPCC